MLRFMLRVNMIAIVGLMLAAVSVVVIALWGVSELPATGLWFMLFPAWIVVGFYTVYHVKSARQADKRYNDLDDWQEQVEPDDGQYDIPESHFDRIRPELQQATNARGDVISREDQVKRVWRQHVILAVQRMFVPVLMGVVFVGLCVAAVLGQNGRLVLATGGSVAEPTSPEAEPGEPIPYGPLFKIIPPENTPSQGVGGVTDIGLPWWLFAVLACLAFMVAWVLSWKWQYIYFVITNHRLIRIVAPPAWLAPFFDIGPISIDLFRIITAYDKTKKMSLGHALNYGEVGVDSDADSGDILLNRIPHTPNLGVVVRIINSERLRERSEVIGQERV